MASNNVLQQLLDIFSGSFLLLKKRKSYPHFGNIVKKYSLEREQDKVNGSCSTVFLSQSAKLQFPKSQELRSLDYFPVR